jgi:hypothetical protein
MMDVIVTAIILVAIATALAVAWYIIHASELRLAFPFGVSLVAIA